MANINNPNIATMGAHPNKVYKVDVESFVASGANLSGGIILETFPPGSYLQAARGRVIDDLDATSLTDSDAVLKFGAAGSETTVLTLTDIDTDLDDEFSVTPVAGSMTEDNILVLVVTNVGANLSAVTAGEIQVAAEVKTLGYLS